jgi:hypothetical protein
MNSEAKFAADCLLSQSQHAAFDEGVFLRGVRGRSLLIFSALLERTLSLEIVNANFNASATK